MKELIGKLSSRDALIVFVLGALFSGVGYLINLIELKSTAEAELNSRQRMEKREKELQEKYEKVIVDNIRMSIRCPE